MRSRVLSNHQSLERLLPAFASSELTGSERALVEAHLEKCPECREWIETHDLLHEAISASPRRAKGEAHPDSAILARFALDPRNLQEDSAARVREHLECCHSCREDVSLCRAAIFLEPGSEEEISAIPSPQRFRAFLSPGSQAIRLAAAACLLIAVTAIGAFLMRGYGEAPYRISLGGSTIQGKQLVEATQSIDATDFVIGPRADVTLRAETVTLGEGFSVGNHARLTIEAGTQ